jgi:NAD(P)-dependent dehydrogenase (short-subunit alcohol dehydrogenase family)
MKTGRYTKKFMIENKIALVLGGSGQIGHEIVKAFGIAGAKVIVADKTIKYDYFDNLEENKIKVIPVKFDCSNLSNVEDNILDITKKYGVPDVFVNCSYPRTKDWSNNNFSEISLSSFSDNINIHLNSFSWIAKIIADQMKQASKGGSIIQLGSIYGVLGQDLKLYEGLDMKENMTYSVIKGGITNLTRQMASYYGQYNIRINTLSPGGLDGIDSGSNKLQNETFKKRYSEKTPLKRLGKPSEVASVALFLASEASSYMTGENLIVDGGYSII